MSTVQSSPDAGPAEQPVMPRQAVDARSRPAAPGADPAVEQRASTDLSRPARIIGTVVAPTSLMTSLFYYFGWSHAYWFFDYLGVNSTLLGLTTGDYLMRSLDALFVPMTALACGALALLWGNAVVPAGLRQARWIPRVLAPVTGVAGVGLSLIGLSAVFGVRTPLTALVAVTPLCLAFGVVLIAYAVHLRRLATSGSPGGSAGPEWRTVAEWLAIYLLVGLSLFWAANDYSAAVGRARAREFVAEMGSYPSMVVYSSQSLSLSAAGVREVRCGNAEAAFRFRYDGLKLVLQAGEQYLVLPSTWSPADGVAILLRRSDSVRVEFAPATSTGAGVGC